MKYISLSWYDIPDFVVPIRISLTRVAANKEATEPRVPFGKVEIITSKTLRSPPWLDWPLWDICVTNDHGYVTLVVNTSRSFPHSWLITGFVTRLTGRVPLVEQELLTRLEQLSSPPVLSGVRVTRSLVLYVCFVDRCLSFWPLCLFFDIRILITPLVSSNSSYTGLVCWIIKHFCPIIYIYTLHQINNLDTRCFMNYSVQNWNFNLA